MASPAQFSRGNGLRKSILELAPLELDCMNTLWPLGEGTVREIQQRLAPTRPRAYTTIMTIMDRLAHKGVVTRHKVGRAYLYRPNLTADQARTHAVEQVVEGFFEGSAEALAAHLAGEAPTAAPARARHDGGRVPAQKPVEKAERPSKESSASPRRRLDEILL